VLYSEAGIGTDILIDTEDSGLLLDVGDGTVRDLIRSGYRSEELSHRLKGILVTHHHYDHIGGLYTLLSYFSLIGRKDPLTIVYPVGAEPLEFLVKYRLENLTEKPEVKLAPLKDGGKYQVANFVIEAFEVLHGSGTIQNPRGARIPSLGYEVRIHEKRLVFSGDTELCGSRSGFGSLRGDRTGRRETALPHEHS